MSFYSRYNGFGFQLPRAAGVASVQVPPALSQPISVPPHVLSILLSAQPQPLATKVTDTTDTRTGDPSDVVITDHRQDAVEAAPPDESLFQKVGPWLWAPIALAAAVTIVVVMKKSKSGSMGRYKRKARRSR